MKISKVQQTKRNKDRYSLYIDGEYKLAVSEDILIKYSLFKDRELTEDELEEIQEAEAHHRLYAAALNYLSYGMRSQKQVEDHIHSTYNKHFEGDLSSEQLEDIIDRLKALSLLDDLAYAKAYVRSHQQLHQKGPRRLEQELFQKGIAKKYISQALEELTAEDTLEQGLSLAEKYVRTQSRFPEQKIREKLYQYLLRKGYPSETVQCILDRVVIEVDPMEETSMLQKELEKQHKRLSRRYEGRDLNNRLIQALLRKGFSYADISTSIAEREADE